MLEKITKAEWDAIHPDYKSVWTTERTDWPNWAEVREQYMGKRTLMRGGSLGVEGISLASVNPLVGEAMSALLVLMAPQHSDLCRLMSPLLAALETVANDGD